MIILLMMGTTHTSRLSGLPQWRDKLWDIGYEVVRLCDPVGKKGHLFFTDTYQGEGINYYTNFFNASIEPVCNPSWKGKNLITSSIELMATPYGVVHEV